jgi:nitroimidazol reductase NimA-like FMN-containing flavoprotein (pyridoxamine 5'-phosphate oxidase superfamily)
MGGSAANAGDHATLAMSASTPETVRSGLGPKVNLIERDPTSPAKILSQKGYTMRVSKRLWRFIERERVCRVATVTEHGTPHLVPVCHVVVNGALCFGSGNDARKVLNLRANDQIAVTVDLYAEDWPQLRGVMVQGRAKLFERGGRFRKIRASLYRKYPQYASEAALDESDSVIVEVSPGHVFSWGFEAGK